MAKNKNKSSTQAKSAAPSAARSSSRTSDRQGADATARKGKGPATTEASAHKRVLSQDEIGAVAGEIWHVLSERGGQNLTALKKSVDAPGDLVLAATGWLAREGKLEFDTSGRAVKLSLR